MIEGWYIAVQTMKIGEKCKLTIQSKYGYGESGAGADIPPNATLIFEIELISFEAKKSLGEKEEYLEVIAKKTEGTNKFRAGEFGPAMNDYYIQAWNLLEDLDADSDDESEEAQGLPVLKVNLCNNIALCAFKISDWKNSMKYSCFALDNDDCNSKALFRRALTFM